MNHIRGLGLLLALLSLMLGSCRTSAPLPDRHTSLARDVAAVEAVEAIEVQLTRLATTMAATTAAASASAPTTTTDRLGTARGPCLAPTPTRMFSAAPTECAGPQAQAQTRAALRTVQLALTRDLALLVARLRRMFQEQRIGQDHWLLITEPVFAPTVTHVEWMTDALQASHELTESADIDQDNDALWQQAARDYESALLGAQVLSVWVSWLEFANILHKATTLDVEMIMVRLVTTWRDIAPVLQTLQALQTGQAQTGWSSEPQDLGDAARTLRSKLPEWTDALIDWGAEARADMRATADLVNTLVLIQAGIELVAMGRLSGTLAKSGSLAGRTSRVVVMLPGIGGVTAGGAATGVRLVVNTEWLAAIRHLVAIGAITTIEVAKLTGTVSIASHPTPPSPAIPKPAETRPATLQRVGESGESASSSASAAASSSAAGQRSVRVLVRHRAGNRQVEVNGQRWHVPKGKSAKRIPATDPVGDRLQTTVDRIARDWSPAKLSGAEQEAIKDARAAGKPWLARLLERQARGRWVEREARLKFTEVQWNHLGVDAVDHGTGIQYEVLSMTRDNLDTHAKRMAGTMFRMITF